ncbi:MAG: nucleotidyltransferase domain-containing protein [Anaerolineales bacterium]
MPAKKIIRKKPKFRIPRKKIAAFCNRWGVTEFSLFGSVLRNDFRPKSDVDVMVVIKPDAHIGLFEVAEMQIELEKLFKRKVDLVEKEGLRNPYRRREILRTAKVIYDAAQAA